MFLSNFPFFCSARISSANRINVLFIRVLYCIVTVNVNIQEYKPPAAKDIPQDFRVTLLKSSRNPVGVLSSKGTRESSRQGTDNSGSYK